MRILILIFLSFLSSPCSAEWVSIPTARLVEQSDLIVVGTLDNVKEWSKGGTDYGKGDISVAEVLWGEAKPDAKLHLAWHNASAIACPRVEHSFNAKKKGIWLLTREKQQVRANYPGRFVPLEQKSDIIKLLEARKRKA